MCVKRLLIGLFTLLWICVMFGCKSIHIAPCSRADSIPDRITSGIDLLSTGEVLEFTASIAKSPESTGMFVATLVASNKGQTTISYLNEDIGDHLSVYVIVTDQTGKEVPLTSYGHSRFDPVSGSIFTSPIAAGQSHMWTVDLRRCFELQPREQYILNASLTASSPAPGGPEFAITAAGLRFRIPDN